MNPIFLTGYAAFLLAAGFRLPSVKSRSLARTLGWAIAAGTVFVSHCMTIGQPSLIRMTVIVFLQLLSMKGLVATESYAQRNGLNVIQWLAFSSWFGMRPQPFEVMPDRPHPYLKLIAKAASRMLAGICLLYLSSKLEHTSFSGFFLPELCLLAGVSLLLHFGVLTLSVAWWRMLGVDVQELFREPYRAKTLKEFWGRRWNLAFSEMTALIVYRPLKSRLGADNAITFSFLLSALLHEIAISLPVMSGFGMPSAYFILHATAMKLESIPGISKKLIQRPLLSRFWVMSILLLPLPVLFHHDFIQYVLVPLRAHVLSLVSI